MRVLAGALAITACTWIGCGADADPPLEPLDAAGALDARPSGGDGSLSGVVTRSAQPMGDARGHVYIALFDKDPVVDMMTAQLVARALVEQADLSGGGASVAYTLVDIAPQAADYYLVAFLDDNGNVSATDPAMAGPDRGDLVSLDGLAAPRVKVPAAGAHEHDIVLNSVLPF